METKVIELLQEQVNKEFYSSYLYLEISNYYADKGLDGFAHWYEVQAREEKDHAMLFYHYLQENNQKVQLKAIAAPDAKLENLQDGLRLALEHEKYVTASIHNIYHEASQVKDFRTTQFLDWFVKEQGEEEKNASDLLTKMELFGHDAKGLYLLDAELKARAYAPPSLTL